MKKPLLFLILTVILNSCHFSTRYVNRESDRQDAEKETNDLFEYIKKSAFEEATELFEPEFYKETSKDELIKIFEHTENKLGALKTLELGDWHTDVSEGAIPHGFYTLNYKGVFEYGDAKLRLNLTKNENGVIKVSGYFINSNAFFN